MSNYKKGASLQTLIHNQLMVWENAKSVKEVVTYPVPFITISREYGCNADAIAEIIAEELNKYEKSNIWKSYDRELIDRIVQDHNITEKLIETIDTVRREEIAEFWRNVLTDYPTQVSVYQKLVKTVRSLCIHGRAIIVGRAGVMITKNLKYGIHLRFVAPLPYRIQKIQELMNIRDRLEAERLVEKKDRERHEFLTQYLKFDAAHPASYDLTVNIARVSPQDIAQMVICIMRSKGYIK
jgi:cytidylate kinase